MVAYTTDVLLHAHRCAGASISTPSLPKAEGGNMIIRTVHIKTEIITPRHPQYGRLLPARVPTHRFENPGHDGARQAGWEWTVLDKLIEHIQQLDPTGCQPAAGLNLGAQLWARYYPLLSFTRRSLRSGTDGPLYNFMLLSCDSLIPEPHFDSKDIDTLRATAISHPENCLVPAGFADAVRKAITSGIFKVDTVSYKDGEDDPDAFYGHPRDYRLKTHMKITLHKREGWRFTPYERDDPDGSKS